MKFKLEFPGGDGVGCKTKNLWQGDYGYFLELHKYSKRRGKKSMS